MTREGFGAVLRPASSGIDDAAVDEYWKAFGDEDRRRGQLELYRSGDFSKLEPYEGKLESWRADAAAVGRGRPLRPRGRRAPFPAADPW